MTTLAQNLWLGSVATQQNLMTVMKFSTVFYGNAALQSVKFGLTAPLMFWAVMARTGAIPVNAIAAIAVVGPTLAAPAPVRAPVFTIVPSVTREAIPEPIIDDAVRPAPVPAVANDLTAIKGIGPKLAQQLSAAGITRFDQLAALQDDQLEQMSSTIPNLFARAVRGGWIMQAEQLAQSQST
ncbi:MAG: putative flap endonuclease-1-like 5' DNA nuclease [Yoonia sp.]|jgi:predicted flap endonuclease-1-like 5' DNA nuclease